MMRFELQIALRFLREGRAQSALIVGGVMVGVAVVVFISALVTGLQSNTIRRTLGAQAHIVAKPVEPAARVQIDAGEASIALVQTAPRKIRSIDNWQQDGMPVEKRGWPGVPSEYDSVACINWLLNREVKKVQGEKPQDRLAAVEGLDGHGRSALIRRGGK